NSGSGVTVGTVTASDPDAGSTFTFAKVAGGTGTVLFNVSSAGVVTVADGAVLNFEGTSSYTLEVQVTDNGTPGLTGSGTVTINLTNVNEAPVLGDASLNVNENSANGTAVGTVTATDVDAGSVLSYSITAISPATDPAAFAINASTGAITVANSAVINHEANPAFTLTVQATDNGSPALSDTATVTVNVNDINDVPVVSGATFSVAENSPATTVVGVVTAADEDLPVQTLSWLITAGNTGGAFTINSATREIIVVNSAALDFETNPTFTLTVTATDNGSPNMTGSATVTINLTGVNEAPVVSDATFTLAENSPVTTVVGTVTATDPENPALTWSITGGNGLGAFAINATSGQITVASSTPLDLETNPTFSLTVQAADPGGLTGSGTVTINLTNANEPPVVVDNAFDLPENSPATTPVGTVTATDPDHTSFTWTITGGNTGNAFTINNSGQITVADAAPVDFETNPTFTLTVKAADAGGLFDEGTVIITLTDVNDAPVVTDSTFSILETVANGSVVGTVVASDQDAGQTLTYSITAGNTGNAFAIDPTNGQITVADNTGFDYSTTPPFSLTIQVVDNGAPNLSDSGTVTVNIQPAADLELTALVGPTNALSGSTGLFTVQVGNIGPGVADAYNVEVTLPAPLTMAATGSTAGCTFVAPVITCPAAALASGATAEIAVAVYFPSSAEGALELQAEIVPGGGDLDANNHSASMTVTVIPNTVVVDDDFEDGADEGWSTDQRSTTPEDGRNFLGEFDNQRITFEAHNLPAHSRATISFDLFIIRSWDGNNLMDGPDRWLMDLDGVTLVNTTFSNWNDVLRQQAYPGSYPGDSNPAQTGAEEVNTLGYLYGSDWLQMDAVYHIEMTVDHSAADLIVALEGTGLSGRSEESWGVDNFKIVLSGQQEHKVYLPLMLR
ncbi:MAG: cadherin repeat domain-containing protein, partial [Anaerolineaceae bacterium]|nr:cadherin repeat domain-containing protein [Anaerolineaceae bacterium]